MGFKSARKQGANGDDRRVTLANRVSLGSEVVFRELDGEAVLLSLATGTYFGLNQVGTRIWSLILEHGSLRDVFAAMSQEYDVAPETLEKDLLELVQQLSAKGLVVVDPGT